MPKYHHVTLSPEQRDDLLGMIRSGAESSRVLSRARVLLHSDEKQPGGAWFADEIAAALHVGSATVERVRRRFAQEGLDAALYDRERPPRAPQKMTGELEAHLVALTCSAPPSGRARWTLRLLAEGMVEAGYIDYLSHETVRQTLQKMNSSRG